MHLPGVACSTPRHSNGAFTPCRAGQDIAMKTNKWMIAGATAMAVAVSGLLLVQPASASPAALALAQESQLTQSITDHIVAEEARIAAEEAARKAEEEARRKAWEAQRYGIGPSAYTGSYYNSGHESTRQCIVRKESGGDYGIRSSNGLWHGAYQFTIGTGNNAARQMGRPDLVGIPANQWTRAEQDQAFWTIWNHGGGRHNWPTARGC